MKFNELFETIDEKIEKYLKNTTDWKWESVQDFHTHEWSSVARCYFDDRDDIFWFLKKAEIELYSKFYVKGIGKLKYDYSSQFVKYYTELIERDNEL